MVSWSSIPMPLFKLVWAMCIFILLLWLLILPRPCRDDFEDKGRQIFVSIIWLKIKYTRSPSTAYNIMSLLFSPITAYVICLMSCSSEACYFLTAYAFMLLLTWTHFRRAIKWLLWSLLSWFQLIICLTVSLDTWQTCMCVVLCLCLIFLTNYHSYVKTYIRMIFLMYVQRPNDQ